MNDLIKIILVSVFALGCKQEKVSSKSVLDLSIKMDGIQPANAPIILILVFENVSEKEIREEFWEHGCYKGILEGPDGEERNFKLGNHFYQQGSFLSSQTPPIQPGNKLEIPFRLGLGYQPSEFIFLSPGKYKLKINYQTFQRDRYSASTEFEVSDNVNLTEDRMRKLQNPPEDREKFYNYVLRTTLTPEVREKWYAQIRKPDLATKEDLSSFGYEMTPLELASHRTYNLSRIHDLIPSEVDSIMLEVLKIYTHKEKDKQINQMLNNAVYTIVESTHPNAGNVLLDLATSDCRPSERIPAIMALRIYFTDEMKERLIPLLKEEDKWTPIITAHLLAWAGYDDGLGILIMSANNGDAYSAAGLRYFPNNKRASEALKEALKSDDKKFLEQLKLNSDRLPPSREKKDKD